MLRDQGLFSQVISWDSRYTDFYSLRGAQEEWCTARSCLQSHCKEFGLLEIKLVFFFPKKYDSKLDNKRLLMWSMSPFLVECDVNIMLLLVTYLVTKSEPIKSI